MSTVSKVFAIILMIAIAGGSIYWLYKLNTKYYPVQRTERVNIDRPNDMPNYIGENG